MALYLTRFSYTPETWAKLMKNPEDRRDAARKYIESVGGKLHGFWYAFGEYDGYNIWEAPDNVSMAAVALAISGGGALSKIETTPLLTVEETLEASAVRRRSVTDRPNEVRRQNSFHPFHCGNKQWSTAQSKRQDEKIKR
jgi:uncharacterized protein with GYD domain